MASSAKASIVIPTYNQNPDFLLAAISSAVEQTVPVEVIVVDDGSEEHVEVPSPVRLVRNFDNQGIAAALNAGIKEMSTDWFCWLSSDDLIVPEKVELQLGACLREEAQASFHRYWVFEPTGTVEISILPRWNSMKHQQQQLGTGCMINGSTVMLHRSVFDDVGLFDTSFRYGQDWEMWARVGRKYRWLALEEILGSRRRSEFNLTAQIGRSDKMRAVRDAEDRRIKDMYGWTSTPR